MGKAKVSAEKQKVFESIYVRHRLEVLAYCTRRVGATDAADACSETFLVAWRRLDDLPPPPRTLPYLYGIAAKVLANHFRGLHRRSRLETMLGALGVVPSPDPSAFVLQSARDEKVQAAVRRLRAKDREIVMLYAWEELSRETIAEILGMSRSAVDQRIHRSYRRLTRVLAPIVEPNPITPPPIANEGGV